MRRDGVAKASELEVSDVFGRAGSPSVLLTAILALVCAAVSARADGQPSDGADAPLPAASPSSPAGPLFQIGVGRFAEWRTEDPLINALKLNPARAISTTLIDGKTKLSFEEMIAEGIYDLTDHSFKNLPKGAWIDVGWIRAGAETAPDWYAGEWIVDWSYEGPGEANVKLTVTPESQWRRAGPTRIELSAPASRMNRSGVRIDRIPDGGRVFAMRAYRARYADDLAAGRVFTPEFKSVVGAYDVVRTMNLAQVNNGHITHADDITPFAAHTWALKGDFPLLRHGPFPRSAPSHNPFAGAPLEAHVILAMEADVALWLNLPPMLGRPDFPAALDWAAADSKAERDAIYRDAVAAPDVAEAVLASREWARLADRIVAQLAVHGYPRDRMLYLEIGNEIWNWAPYFNKSTRHFAGLGAYLKTQDGWPGGGPLRVAYGYVSAMFAEEFAAALRRAGRPNQAWTMVIATHTPTERRLRESLRGVQWYAERSSSAEPMSRFGYASTGYYSGGFRWERKNLLFGEPLSKADWTKRWKAAFRADPGALAQRIEDYLLDQRPMGRNLQALINFRRDNAAVAAEFGARFIGEYEGGSHDTLERALAADRKISAFYREFLRSERAGRIQTAVISALLADAPDAMVSNFEIANPSGDNPWGDIIHIGDTTPVHEAWIAAAAQ